MKPTVPNLNQTTWTALFWTKFEDRLLSGMHPVGPRHWHHGGDRGGAPPPLCSYDPRQGRSASDGTTTFLHARPKCPGRSPSLCISDALYPRWPSRPVRHDKLAACCDRHSPAGWNDAAWRLPPALPPPRLRVAAQKVGCWRPGFWVPSLLLVAPFMRWARRHWSVPPPVLRERLARRAAVGRPARRAAVPPVVRSRRVLPARQRVARCRRCLHLQSCFLQLLAARNSPLLLQHECCEKLEWGCRVRAGTG